jgi:hypothetical protein
MPTPDAGLHAGSPRAREDDRSAEIPHEHSDDLRRLACELTKRTHDVVAGMGERTRRSGVVLDDAVEDSFAKVGVLSTVAVAKWMAGEGVEVARDVGQESWCIFGQLAAQRHAPLNEVQALPALVRRRRRRRARCGGGAAADA